MTVAFLVWYFAYVLLSTYALALCSRIFITVKLADLSGELAAYFGARRWDKMFSGQATFGLWCMLAAGSGSLSHPHPHPV